MRGVLDLVPWSEFAVLRGGLSRSFAHPFYEQFLLRMEDGIHEI
jgi:hypothetical protein